MKSTKFAVAGLTVAAFVYFAPGVIASEGAKVLPEKSEKPVISERYYLPESPDISPKVDISGPTFTAGPSYYLPESPDISPKVDISGPTFTAGPINCPAVSPCN